MKLGHIYSSPTSLYKTEIQDEIFICQNSKKHTYKIIKENHKNFNYVIQILDNQICSYFSHSSFPRLSQTQNHSEHSRLSQTHSSKTRNCSKSILKYTGTTKIISSEKFLKLKEKAEGKDSIESSQFKPSISLQKNRECEHILYVIGNVFYYSKYLARLYHPEVFCSDNIPSKLHRNCLGNIPSKLHRNCSNNIPSYNQKNLQYIFDKTFTTIILDGQIEFTILYYDQFFLELVSFLNRQLLSKEIINIEFKNTVYQILQIAKTHKFIFIIINMIMEFIMFYDNTIAAEIVSDILMKIPSHIRSKILQTFF